MSIFTNFVIKRALPKSLFHLQVLVKLVNELSVSTGDGFEG